MAYRTLKSVFHQKSQAAADAEEAARRVSPAAVHWDFLIGKSRMFCLLTPETVVLIERIMVLENRARGLWDRLSGAVRYHYLRSMIIEEIYATNEIESVYSTRQEIAEALDAVKRVAPSERHRFREMARLYQTLGEGEVTAPESLDDIRSVYDEVTDGEVTGGDLPDGVRFRSGPVQIFSGQKVVHQGAPSEEHIEAGLAEMLRQSSDETIPSLVRAVAAHFIFESTHPFYDGNGRTGRYLLALDLSRSLSPVAWLSLSSTVADNKARYYKAFQDAEHPMNSGDATVFVMEMLGIIAEAQERLCTELDLRHHQINRMFAKLEELETDDDSPLPSDLKGIPEVLGIIGQASLFGVRGEVELDTVARSLSRSKQYVRPRTRKLVEYEFVEEISEKPLRFRLTGRGRALLGLIEDS